jgi:hypothetical protein
LPLFTSDSISSPTSATTPFSKSKLQFYSQIPIYFARPNPLMSAPSSVSISTISPSTSSSTSSIPSPLSYPSSSTVGSSTSIPFPVYGFSFKDHPLMGKNQNSQSIHPFDLSFLSLIYHWVILL